MKLINLIYLTNPIIIHAHGYSYRKDKNKELLFDRLKKKLLSEPKRDIGPIQDLTIVTWSNKDEKTPLEENLEHLGLPYHVLGKEHTGAQWQLKFKPETLDAAIPDIKTEYILCLDSFDVLLFTSPRVALERFRKSGCEMLFNASVYNWPEGFETSGFEESVASAKFRYLNGGCFITRLQFLRELLRENLSRMRDNYGDYTEQMFYRLMYRKYYPKIKIDSRCEIFQSLKRVKARLFMGNLFVA